MIMTGNLSFSHVNAFSTAKKLGIRWVSYGPITSTHLYLVASFESGGPHVACRAVSTAPRLHEKHEEHSVSSHTASRQKTNNVRTRSTTKTTREHVVSSYSTAIDNLGFLTWMFGCCCEKILVFSRNLHDMQVPTAFSDWLEAHVKDISFIHTTWTILKQSLSDDPVRIISRYRRLRIEAEGWWDELRPWRGSEAQLGRSRLGTRKYQYLPIYINGSFPGPARADDIRIQSSTSCSNVAISASFALFLEFSKFWRKCRMGNRSHLSEIRA
jgi:hypothetical protein